MYDIARTPRKRRRDASLHHCTGIPAQLEQGFKSIGSCYVETMRGARSRFPLGRWLVLGLVCLASCSNGTLTDDGVPTACNAPLPKRCDLCPTGELVCAHYVVRGGVCTVETCPLASLPDASALPTQISDASVPVVDAITPVGPSYDCGPADAGLRCSCGLEPYFPAPINAAGQQQTFVLTPDPAAVVAYHTMAEFDALAVGRWQRTAGQGELVCEQFGVEFTADHRLIPLVIASDGSVQAVTARATSFTISFDSAGAPKWLEVPGLLTNPPTFFDAGRSMYLLYSPWPANYVRAP
jgi:hypothetical protein